MPWRSGVWPTHAKDGLSHVTQGFLPGFEMKEVAFRTDGVAKWIWGVKEFHRF